MAMTRQHAPVSLGRLLTVLVVVLWALALLLLVGDRAGAQGSHDAYAGRHARPPAARMQHRAGVPSGLLKTEP